MWGSFLVRGKMDTRYGMLSSLKKDKKGMHMARNHHEREDVTHAKLRPAPELYRDSQATADFNLDMRNYQNFGERDNITDAKISIC